ncbi:DUF3558 domain-containing protein [Amycolatopsis rubida]|uniref:DUF3558 domain-containing protein n=1 Tax=Amycolatopsis rubida TaxID=112413 RepID=A0A1I5Y1I2_9PSEU|nr:MULTISPECIES: DUF3558 domain-containing protein [Amycolatopsis]MYW91032.1 DUF3558 domain-containing protein [Amycolatopsis rubida]NEC56017.1 DUF3558 domain-containing protein [Amycolatopsis rubida]OAP22174.1 hypothetical protein A4R44_06984 [Amycolatopsis sp. M39]SFQ38045.1 Protein of unknown function [Amycolatopsis rubida]
MTRRLPAVLVAAGLASLAAACSGGQTPAPTSVPETGPSAPAALPHSGAPKVEHPLPSSVLSGDPCRTALTKTQVGRIITTMPAGKARTLSGLGPTCDWSNIDSGAAVRVGYVTDDHQGLSAVYQNSRPKVKVWRPLPPIQGFPAVAFSDFDGIGLNSACQVSFGTSDDLSVDVSITLGESKAGKADPCAVAAQAADIVVTNLRQRAGA